ncbi:MAG: type II toxin-antitoxin system RelE/ParE family toxin [Clostridia bacterium]
MKYTIKYKKKALKFIQKQPKNQQERIIKAIEELPNGDIVHVETTNKYRLRVGDYRIIFEINNFELIITVVNAGNRGQIYNRY